MQLLKQGAEARIYKIPFLEKQAIVKQRLRKTYRIPELDAKLTHRRVLQEARCMQKCLKSGVDTPIVYLVDTIHNSIYMEYIDGPSLRDYIAEKKTLDKQEASVLALHFGQLLGQLHSLDIVHGDLTTSNVLLRSTSHELVLIDFGLSQISSLAEDKAVDLYVLERAFDSTHPGTQDMFQAILESYGQSYKEGRLVLKKLEQVRQRGRKRTAFG